MSEIIKRKIVDYQFIIWDWNGTLLNDSQLGAQAEAELFKRYGLPAQTPEERLKNFFMPIQKYYEKMGFDFKKHDYDKVADEWLEIYEQLALHAHLFDGISQLIEELHRLDKRQFVLSAAPQDHVHLMTRKHNLSPYLMAAYGLKDNRAESKLERGRELVRDFGIPTESTILIGDTTHDYEVGSALGIDVLLVSDGHNSAEALREVHHNVISRFALH